jgi:hypothetical protein
MVVSAKETPRVLSIAKASNGIFKTKIARFFRGWPASRHSTGNVGAVREVWKDLLL